MAAGEPQPPTHPLTRAAAVESTNARSSAYIARNSAMSSRDPPAGSTSGGSPPHGRNGPAARSWSRRGRGPLRCGSGEASASARFLGRPVEHGRAVLRRDGTLRGRRGRSRRRRGDPHRRSRKGRSRPLWSRCDRRCERRSGPRACRRRSRRACERHHPGTRTGCRDPRINPWRTWPFAPPPEARGLSAPRAAARARAGRKSDMAGLLRCCRCHTRSEQPPRQSPCGRRPAVSKRPRAGRWLAATCPTVADDRSAIYAVSVGGRTPRPAHEAATSCRYLGTQAGIDTGGRMR